MKKIIYVLIIFLSLFFITNIVSLASPSRLTITDNDLLTLEQIEMLEQRLNRLSAKYNVEVYIGVFDASTFPALDLMSKNHREQIDNNRVRDYIHVGVSDKYFLISYIGKTKHYELSGSTMFTLENEFAESPSNGIIEIVAAIEEQAKNIYSQQQESRDSESFNKALHSVGQFWFIDLLIAFGVTQFLSSKIQRKKVESEKPVEITRYLKNQSFATTVQNRRFVARHGTMSRSTRRNPHYNKEETT